MSDPVKLSRERWDALWNAMHELRFDNTSASDFLPTKINLVAPLQTQGVIFLPAEYVPLEAPRA